MNAQDAMRQRLRAMFDAAVAAAQPALCVPRHLPAPPKGRLVVIGAGKASAAMARAVEDHWPGELSGLVVTRYGYAVPCRRIEIVEAAHPVPDAAGSRCPPHAGDSRRADDRRPRAVPDLRRRLVAAASCACRASRWRTSRPSTARCSASGATISEMNCVRRHLSAIKGGRLAAACQSGTRSEPVAVRCAWRPPEWTSPRGQPSPIRAPAPMRWTSCGAMRSTCPPRALVLLESGEGETLKPGDPRLPDIETRFVATPQMALEAAAAVAPGCRPSTLHPRRCHRRRGARGRQDHGRHRAASGPPGPAGGRALRAAVRRRDHGDRARQGPRRAQRRVPAGARHRTRTASRASMRSRATPTVSTARRRSPARC